MSKYYGDDVNTWSYDEGQMGAWFVMSAIGLFQMNGGASVNPFYEIGSPIIYIQSIIPTNDAIHTTRKNSDIIMINNQLKLIAERNGLTYIDLFSVFKLDNNRLNPEYSIDGLHLNGKGYLLWKKEIEKYVIN